MGETVCTCAVCLHGWGRGTLEPVSVQRDDSVTDAERLDERGACTGAWGTLELKEANT